MNTEERNEKTDNLDKQISITLTRIDKIIKGVSDDAGVIVSVAFMKQLWDVLDEVNAHQTNLQRLLNDCNEKQVQA